MVQVQFVSAEFMRDLEASRTVAEQRLGEEIRGKLTPEQFDGWVDNIVAASGMPPSIAWPDGTTARIWGETPRGRGLIGASRGCGKSEAVRLMRGLWLDPFPFTIAPKPEPSAPRRRRGLQAVLDAT